MDIKKRLLEQKVDNRGQLVEVFPGSVMGQPNWGLVYLFSVNPGVIRGNHYHQHKNEWFFIAQGQVELVLGDREASEQTTLLLSEEQPEVVFIPAGVAHAVRNTRSTTAVVIAYIDQEFDPDNPDTFYCDLI